MKKSLLINMERDLTESFKNDVRVKKIEIDEGFNNINIDVYYFDDVITMTRHREILDEDKIYVRYYEEDRQDQLNAILDIEEAFLNKYPGFKFDFINIPIP